MSREPVRLGIVGCGRLAELGYVPAAARVDALRVVAVADPDGARRDLVATAVASSTSTRGECATFTDAGELLDGADVDALVVASPVSAHVADATRATEAGVTVLVEKPPAPDLAGVAALARLEPRPWVGFNRRFDPGARSVRDRVPAAGALDLYLEISYRRRGWGAVCVRDDALLDLGPHLIDWTRWLTGAGVDAVERAELSGDQAELELVLANGRGRAHLVAHTDRLHRERIDVRDASGARIARARVGGPVAVVTGRLRRGPHPLVVTLAAQLDALANVVRGGEPRALGTVDDAAAVMAVVDAARMSAASSRSTRVIDRVEA